MSMPGFVLKIALSEVQNVISGNDVLNPGAWPLARTPLSSQPAPFRPCLRLRCPIFPFLFFPFLPEKIYQRNQ